MGFSVVIAAAALVAGTFGNAPHATQVTLFASPTGSGTACTQSQPCGLAQAQQTVRTMTGQATGDIVVDLAGGTYRLTSPLRFGVQDSGLNGHKVVYQAVPGQTPVLSGGLRVTGFTLFDATKNIFRAPVPAGTTSRQLFVDGVRAARDRGATNPAGFSLSTTGFTTGDPAYATWTNTDQVEVVQNNAWKQMRCPLSGITATSAGGSAL